VCVTNCLYFTVNVLDLPFASPSSDIIAKYVYKSLSNKHVLIFVVTSRRGDLEILGYVMLQWLCDRLPWEKNLSDKEYVSNEKTS